MATLPDTYKLRRAAPRSVEMVPSVPNPVVPDSAGRKSEIIARNLREASRDIDEIVLRDAKFRSAQAMSDFMSFKTVLDERTKDGLTEEGETPDWGNLDARYNAELDKEIQRLSESLRGNTAAREDFMEKALPLASSGQAYAESISRIKMREEDRAAVLDKLDKAAMAMQTSLSPEDTQAQREAIHSMLHSRPDVFSPEEAGRLERATMDRVTRGRIDTVAGESPHKALALLNSDLVTNNLDPGEVARIRTRLEKMAKIDEVDNINQWALNEARRLAASGAPLEEQLRIANAITDQKRRDALVSRVAGQYKLNRDMKQAQSREVYEAYDEKLGQKDDQGHVFSMKDIPVAERAQLLPEHYTNMERIFKQRTMKAEPKHNFGMDVYMEQLAGRGEWDKMMDIVLHSGSTMPTSQRAGWRNAIKAMQVPPDIRQESDDTQTLIMAYGSTHDGKVLEKDAPELLGMRNELRKWRTEQALVNKKQPSKIERDQFLQQLFIDRMYTPADTKYWHQPPVIEDWYDMSLDERAEYLESLKVKDEELFNTIAAKYVSAGLEPDTLGFILEFESREAAKLLRRPVLKKKQ